jgi:hypothetical protein
VNDSTYPQFDEEIRWGGRRGGREGGKEGRKGTRSGKVLAR